MTDTQIAWRSVVVSLRILLDSISKLMTVIFAPYIAQRREIGYALTIGASLGFSLGSWVIMTDMILRSAS